MLTEEERSFLVFMNRTAHIVQSATPSDAVQFRKRAYGKGGIRDFLRDVLAMANVSADGHRYIVVGMDFDAEGKKRVHGVKRDDFGGKPAYAELVSDHIEPAVHVHYERVTHGDKQVGVFEIGDCDDRPYMMRVDHSETLRRGDAYLRVNDEAVKMGRRQLLTLFEQQFQESVSPASIEVGFPGEIIHKKLKVPPCNFDKLPSAVAAAKLQELIDVKNQVHTSLVSTIVARLTHARLFGSDSPYEQRSVEELMAELQHLKSQYREHDDHFLFEQKATRLQLVVYNQGGEALRDVKYALLLPVHDELCIADQLPKLQRDGSFAERAPRERSEYPTVTQRESAIRVAGSLDEIPAGEPVELLRSPLRICVGTALKGRRVGIQYQLNAANLRTPAKGTLRLLF